jgi:hypothetical protein
VDYQFDINRPGVTQRQPPIWSVQVTAIEGKNVVEGVTILKCRMHNGKVIWIPCDHRPNNPSTFAIIVWRQPLGGFRMEVFDQAINPNYIQAGDWVGLPSDPYIDKLMTDPDVPSWGANWVFLRRSPR